MLGLALLFKNSRLKNYRGKKRTLSARFRTSFPILFEEIDPKT